ncbi:hypothetical protein HG537_0C02400 [Torulaspora globosa]|uniref:Aldehyde dehydrogenase domain-containing protein n=1 Tax=Torulaspora globosa TaxID=48254 RepID=A0A7H9HQM7_9SACH|nr:hypothetical protein HG537_0C02400 [Torulaspora sp. CBS 2947]
MLRNLTVQARRNMSLNGLRWFSSSFTDPDLFKNKAFIDGEWIEKAESFEVRNPSTQEVIGQISSCGSEDFQNAVNAATVAYDTFRHTTPEYRSQVLYNIYELATANQEDLARLITLETGKPFRNSLGEVAYSANTFKWFAEEANRLYGSVLSATSSADRQMLHVKRPLGVIGIMTSWNSPNAVVARKLAPALAAGNACVIRPAVETPLSALALGWLCEQAGLPAGVCNILPSKSCKDAGKYLCSNPQIKKIVYSGSQQLGRSLMMQCVKDNPIVKKFSMELSGNAPFIILEDADIDKALDDIIDFKFGQYAQTCANRIFAHKKIYEQFAARLTERIEEVFHLGDGFDKGVTHGPLINVEAVERISAFVGKAKQSGARVLTGGSRAEALGPLFYRPTVLADVDASMEIFHKEFYGPVASLIKFNDAEDAIRMASNVDLAPAGFLYTNDIKRAYLVATELKARIVSINTCEISNCAISAAGTGNGISKYGLDEYTETKSIVLEP